MSMMKMHGGRIVQSAQAPIHTSEQHRGDNIYLEEQCSNHSGIEDATLFLKNWGGNGTAITAGHRMHLSTGTGVAGHGDWYVQVFPTTSNSIEFSMSAVVNNMTGGAGANRHVKIGFAKDAILSPNTTDEAVFWWKDDDTWVFNCKKGAVNRSSAAFAVLDGDLLSVVMRARGIEAWINNILVYTEASPTYITTEYVQPCAIAICTGVAVTVAREIGICYIGYRVTRRH